MKLPIKKQHFDLIKSGYKTFEYRDAHITFICEETGEELKMKVVNVEVVRTDSIFTCMANPDLFDDKCVMCFELERGDGDE